MHRARLAGLALSGLALAAACGDNGPSVSPRVVVAPILDSLFVGDGSGSDFLCRPTRPWALWSIQTNPPAALPVRGTFVAPLIADNSRRCG